MDLGNQEWIVACEPDNHNDRLEKECLSVLLEYIYLLCVITKANNIELHYQL